MALSAEGLANAIFAKMDATYDGMSESKEETMKYLRTFADGIIEYLVANTDVLPGTFANSAGNVSGIGKLE